MALETEDGIVIVTTCEDGAFAVASGEVSTIVKGEFFGGEEELMLTTRSSKDLSDDHDSKRRRSTYSVSKKLEILHKYETLYKRNARKTERETGVPRKCIQRWLQQRDKIEELARSYYDAYGHELQGFTVRESRAVFPELEAELAGYVMQHQGVTRSEVSRLAINIFPTVYPSKDPSCFKASKHWFNNFMQRLKEGVDYVPKAKAREELEKATRNHPVCVSQDFRVPSACKGRALVAGVDPKLSIETIRNDVTGDAVLRSVLNITGGQGDQEEVEGDEGGPKKSRSTYSLPFKHNVIQKYYGEFGQSITKASKTLGIPRKCIHRWLQQRRKIEAQLELNHKSVEGKGAQPDKPCPENQVTTLSEETTFCTREDKIENPLLGSYQAPSLKTDTSHPIKLPTLVARKARSMYSVEYKRNTIEKYDRLYNGSIRRTARETGIPRKCVQRWVRQRRQIEELVSTEGGESMRRLRLFDPNKRTLPIHQKGLSKNRRWSKNGKISSASITCASCKESDIAVSKDNITKAKARDESAGLCEKNSCNLNVAKQDFNFEMLEDGDGETIITVLPSDLIDVSSCYVKEPRLGLGDKNSSGSRRIRSSYTLSMKLTALENYYNKYGRNCRMTAREMGIPRKCVQRWVQQKDKIQQWSRVKEHNALKKLFTFRGRKPEYPELESELLSSMQQVRRLGKSLTVKELGEKAKKLFLQLYPQRDPTVFKASSHWVRNFLKRTQESADDFRDKKGYHESGRDLLEKVHSNNEHIYSFNQGCCETDENCLESHALEASPKCYSSSSGEDGEGEVVKVQIEDTGDNSTIGKEYIESDDLLPSMISVTRTIPYIWEACSPR